MAVAIPAGISFQSNLKPETLYASRELSELINLDFTATKILSTVRVDISVNSHGWQPSMSELPKA